VILSPTFVVRRAAASTPYEATKAPRFLNNPLIFPDDPVATYQGARVDSQRNCRRAEGNASSRRLYCAVRLRCVVPSDCYFYYDDSDNTPLKSGDAKYRTKTVMSQASVSFKPAYDPAVYKDLQLFVPYDALNMESGEEYDLKFYLALYDNEGQRFFGKSGWYKFHLTMP
jgi:hypothetical protein